MARIVELSPVFAAAASTQFRYVNGIWNSRLQTERLAVQFPAAAAGRTAAIFSLSIPETGTTDLAAQFAVIERDLEADLAVVPA